MKGCYTNIMLLFCSILFPILIISTASDTISVGQSIRDGDTLVSSDGIFVLGFFSLEDSKERFVGVWYNISVSTVVWVANRDTPLVDSSGVLTVTNQGILTILNQNKTIIWSSNSSRLGNSPIAQILDSGNLVVRDRSDNNPENFLWQSFDYPRDTLLPGGKWGIDLETGLDRYLSSWKSSTDPAEGEYTFKVDPYGLPQSYLRKGSVIQFRSGPWNGLRFSGRPNLKPNPLYKFNFIYNEKEIYFAYEPYNSSVLMRTIVSLEGHMQRYLWNDRSHDWILYLAAQTDRCDTYALCGVYGSCNIDNSPICGCLKGFVPKSQRDWDMADWSKGCVRRTPLNCQKGDGFVKYASVKVPDTHHSWYNKLMKIEECAMMCLKNCTCTAYSSLDISTPGGSGCLLWFDELIDIREYTVDGQDIYIRMVSSEISRIGSNEQKQKKIIASLVSLTALLFVLGLILYERRRKNNNSKKKMLNREGEMGNNSKRGCDTESQKEDLELPLFDLATLVNATDYFSIDNKLGEGGFGPVYKMVDNSGGGDVYGSNPSPSSILQGLFASSSSHQPQSSMEYHPNYAASYIDMNNSNNEVLLPHSHFMRNSPPKQQQPPAQNSQLHCSNNGQFWNAPAAATTTSMMSGDHLRSSYLPSSLHQPQFSATPSFEEKPKPNTSVVKKSGSEVSMKRPQNETSSSPLPAFKVRKEKMGDRITALQQLVSPFGKTDTVSVLSEAHEYIKFLHEQVTVLSTAYLKSGASIHHHHQSLDKSKDHEGGPRQDLRSRGLCLVPVSTIYPVNHETTVDFWTPTFGGTFR